ncbi:electron transport complex subunit RsxG [Cellvibrio japonicus]|uniref:Ion-translocating oxidoreductase complex subunit G n=1 Tax=Cellvibrio japonicus (strain Ueda107) TaxID=498211 RepID=B3PB32_CELJU|nr:electron transport complex subunit RsxG [Cellvibrio japonicus]ACE83546.1 rnfE [Cellvibrio japonicus Ueda107]QEI11625.1 electron transport complex subunit RsxG [Cellvibrio japonicus]QEI15199.1 electron transport complex subunit RsxG [Cellvibrio japonicus]QEI18779.1 electron transport complex subunit RsxG [Cellvibrio japonicus]
MLGKSISKNSLILAAFAIATAGTLALTNLGTQERIANAERAAQQKALYDIVPLSDHDNDLLTDTLDIPPSAWPALGLSNNERKIHRARRAGEIIALIVPATAPDGYSGNIDMIVGVKRDGTIAGVRITLHKETPGLGDKIELKKHQWILSFNGKSLLVPVLEEWKVKKDGGIFDQFAGATITPRAVVGQVKRVLEFVAANQDNLFNEATATGGEQ